MGLIFFQIFAVKKPKKGIDHNFPQAMLADKREAAALGEKVEGVALALNSSAAVARTLRKCKIRQD